MCSPSTLKGILWKGVFSPDATDPCWRKSTGTGTTKETKTNEYIHLVAVYDTNNNLQTLYRNGERDQFTNGMS